jgi:hypothetical protein
VIMAINRRRSPSPVANRRAGDSSGSYPVWVHASDGSGGSGDCAPGSTDCSSSDGGGGGSGGE